MGRSLVPLLAVTLGWLLATVPSVPAHADGTASSRAEILHLLSQHRANHALRQYFDLPGHRRAVLREHLRSNLRPVETWVRELDRAGPGILCLGENHRAGSRRFIAERLFPHYRIDRLVLETSPIEAWRIEASVRSGGAAPELLGVDISAPVAAAQARNPELLITGLEGSVEQWGEQRHESADSGRDERVAQRFWGVYSPGARHVLLYGGLHCANWSWWLFHYLQAAAPADQNLELQSVRVLAADQDASVHAFMRFARALGIADGDIALVRTEAVPPEVRTWFPLLNQSMFEAFDTLVVYGTGRSAQRRIVRSESSPDVAPRDFPHWTAGGVTHKPATDSTFPHTTD